METKKHLSHAAGVAFIAVVALANFAAQAAEKLADDDFHENLLVSFAEYSDWPKKDQIQYMAEWRRAWTNFELGIQQRGQSFAGHTRDSWTNLLARLFVPESFSAPSKRGQCLVGGWREELNTQNLCPTRSHPCGDPADEGFECSAIYSHTCVERLPVKTLSKRCSEGAHDTPLKENQYNERRHALEDLLHDCQSKAFPSRFNDNCNLLLHDAKGVIEKFTQRTKELAQENESKQPDATQAGPPKYCENNRVVRVYKSLGGRSDIALARTRQAIANGARVEVRGECDSACVDWPAMVPKERVCVSPDAKLGFHLYTQVTPFGIFVDQQITKEVFSHYHPEIRSWLKDKRLTLQKMRFLQGPELRAIYQSCDELYAACRAQKGSNWTPAKRQPQLIPEKIIN